MDLLNNIQNKNCDVCKEFKYLTKPNKTIQLPWLNSYDYPDEVNPSEFVSPYLHLDTPIKVFEFNSINILQQLLESDDLPNLMNEYVKYYFVTIRPNRKIRIVKNDNDFYIQLPNNENIEIESELNGDKITVDTIEKLNTHQLIPINEFMEFLIHESPVGKFYGGEEETNMKTPPAKIALYIILFLLLVSLVVLIVFVIIKVSKRSSSSVNNSSEQANK